MTPKLIKITCVWLICIITKIESLTSNLTSFVSKFTTFSFKEFHKQALKMSMLFEIWAIMICIYSSRMKKSEHLAILMSLKFVCTHNRYTRTTTIKLSRNFAGQLITTNNLLTVCVLYTDQELQWSFMTTLLASRPEKKTEKPMRILHHLFKEIKNINE